VVQVAAVLVEVLVYHMQVVPAHKDKGSQAEPAEPEPMEVEVEVVLDQEVKTLDPV
jgi:hypothetical protein